MICTIEEHPKGAPVSGELEEQHDMTIVALYGDVLIVDEGKSRKEWVRRDSRPACFALNVDGYWYEFARSINKPL